MQLPKIKEINEKLNNKEPMTAVEKFIATYYPLLGSDHEKEEFRELLKEMIKEVEDGVKK